MKYFIISVLLLLSCKSVIKKESDNHTSESTQIVNNSDNDTKDSITNSNYLIDSLYIGLKYSNDISFKNIVFVESEPYEFLSVDSEMNSIQISIYKDTNIYYAILEVADGIIDNNWEGVEKTITDIRTFNITYDYCWYPVLNKSGEAESIGFLGIGINSKDTINDRLTPSVSYKTEVIYDANYHLGKFKELEWNKDTFKCSDGY